MAARGWMGVREEVERRTAGEQRGRERETEKEVGKHQLNEVGKKCAGGGED